MPENLKKVTRRDVLQWVVETYVVTVEEADDLVQRGYDATHGRDCRQEFQPATYYVWNWTHVRAWIAANAEVEGFRERPAAAPPKPAARKIEEPELFDTKKFR